MIPVTIKTRTIIEPIIEIGTSLLRIKDVYAYENTFRVIAHLLLTLQIDQMLKKNKSKEEIMRVLDIPESYLITYLRDGTCFS